MWNTAAYCMTCDRRVTLASEWCQHCGAEFVGRPPVTGEKGVDRP